MAEFQILLDFYLNFIFDYYFFVYIWVHARRMLWDIGQPRETEGGQGRRVTWVTLWDESVE